MSNNCLIIFGIVEIVLAFWFVGLCRKRAPVGQLVFAGLFLLGGGGLAIASRRAMEAVFEHAATQSAGDRASELSNGISQGLTWMLGAFGCAIMTTIILSIASRRVRAAEIPAARVID